MRTLVAVVIPIVVPLALIAQSSQQLSTLTGIVVDSVHNAPLSGAEVRVGPLRARTNGDGHFEVGGIPRGTYRIEVTHPMITSLGLSVGADSVRFENSQNLSALFAIPSAASVRKMNCAAVESAAGPHGVLVGVVQTAAKRAPVESATVVLSWLEVGFQKGIGLITTQRFAHARTDKSGIYRFCNLEDSLEAVVSAQTATASTAALRINLDGGLGTRLLLLPDTVDKGARSVVRGRVANAQHFPVVGARVELMGFSDTARTSADGSFYLGLPSLGTQMLRIRSIGFDEFMTPLDITPSDTAVVAVELAKTPPSLATVFIRARFSDVAERSGFAKRALVGPGHYITAADIAKRRAPCLLDNIAWVLSFRVTDRRGCYGNIEGRFAVGFTVNRLPSGPISTETPALARASARIAADFEAGANNSPGLSGGCVSVIIDDDRSSTDALAALHPSDVVGIELYQPAFAPARWTAGTSCAAIIVWTRHYQGRAR